MEGRVYKNRIFRTSKGGLGVWVLQKKYRLSILRVILALCIKYKQLKSEKPNLQFLSVIDFF